LTCYLVTSCEHFNF